MRNRLIVVLFIFSVVSLCNADYTSVLLQVVHRHGSRTPIATANTSIVCPTGCGNLDSEGKDMMVQLGMYLKTLVPSFPDSYDPLIAYTTADNDDRIILSADGVLRGLFPNISDFYPVINMLAPRTDPTVLVDAIPSHEVPMLSNLTAIYSELLPKAQARFTTDDLTAMGYESGLVELCTNITNEVNCLLQLQDIAASWRAEGTLANHTVMSAKFNDLQEMRSALNAMLYPYNRANYVDRQRGCLGQATLQAIIANFNNYLAGHQQYKFFEFSTHDTSVMPVFACLGYETMTLPPFGIMISFELLVDPQDQKKAPLVQVRSGSPPQLPGNHTYNVTLLPLYCIGEQDQIYYSADGRCPLIDFVKYVNRSKWQSPDGMCYLAPEVREQVGCNVVQTTPQDLCLWYRQMCPQQACPSDYYLDYSDYSCKPIKNGTSSSDATTVVCCAAFGGLLLGAIMALIVVKMLSPVSAKDQYMEVEDQH